MTLIPHVVRTFNMASTTRPLRPALISVVGATGTGKSQLAVDLAKALDGEIINADAMQMYKGLDIITNKITEEEKCGVPHHLLGFLNVRDMFRVGQFVKEAERTIEDIRQRGKVPILVGGTHYYVQSLLFPHSLPQPDNTTKREDGNDSYPLPPTNVNLAEKYPLLDAPTPVLYETLKSIDPLIATRWHPNDRRKIRRSLEIYYSTGCTKIASEVYAEQREQKRQYQKPSSVSECNDIKSADGASASLSRYENLIFWVHANMDVLKQRLDTRVEKMIDGGMWEEIEKMEELYESLGGRSNGKTDGVEGLVDLNSGIWQSIGFKEFLPYLKMRKRSGEIGKNELENVRLDGVERMKSATRQYARTQVRWIRIKFLNALRAGKSVKEDVMADGEGLHKKSGNESGEIFLLDSTDVSKYDENVSKTAISIAKDFLKSSYSPLPDPASLSELAATSLTSKRDYDFSQRPDLWVQKKCDLCEVVSTNEIEWTQHVDSQRHKRAVKKEKNKTEVERWKKLKKSGKLKVDEIKEEEVWGELLAVLEEAAKRGNEEEEQEARIESTEGF